MAVACHLGFTHRPDLEAFGRGRGAFNADNCLGAIRTTSLDAAIAISFCESYITSNLVAITATASTTETRAEQTITATPGTTTTAYGMEYATTVTLPALAKVTPVSPATCAPSEYKYVLEYIHF
ncbi:hypothetical protein PVAG01_06968 [Phlyctema vagabunda]|uniref:Uncharacterized protein n=1 Tax=Phlyctema vagabunda TaxID=108571 RepID=A0ABR4PB41_9HELO